jgi:uncharacterized membrane protein HdeD (DUF308 family)
MLVIMLSSIVIAFPLASAIFVVLVAAIVLLLSGIVSIILGLRAERPEQVKPMLDQALEHNGPALVDVVVNPQELLIPPTINLEQIRGFTLYMIKAVLNGRGDEIVDLAKTNLFR